MSVLRAIHNTYTPRTHFGWRRIDIKIRTSSIPFPCIMFKSEKAKENHSICCGFSFAATIILADKLNSCISLNHADHQFLRFLHGSEMICCIRTVSHCKLYGAHFLPALRQIRYPLAYVRMPQKCFLWYMCHNTFHQMYC